MVAFLSLLSLCLYVIGFFVAPWWLGIPIILAGGVLSSLMLAALIDDGSESH